MARKTKQDAQITRNAILDAAEIVFYEKGVAAARLEDIARAAGVTRGALYWHFENKPAIFCAMHERLPCDQHETFLAELEKTTDPLRLFEDYCVQFLHDLEDDEQMRRVFNIMILKCDYSGDMAAFRERQNRQRDELMEVFTAAFSRMREQGQMNKSLEPENAALSLFCYMTGIITIFAQQEGAIHMKKQARPLLRQFLNGLK